MFISPFFKKILLLLNHNFRPFGSLLSLEEKMIKISIKKQFFPKISQRIKDYISLNESLKPELAEV